MSADDLIHYHVRYAQNHGRKVTKITLGDVLFNEWANELQGRLDALGLKAERIDQISQYEDEWGAIPVDVKTHSETPIILETEQM